MPKSLLYSTIVLLGASAFIGCGYSPRRATQIRPADAISLVLKFDKALSEQMAKSKSNGMSLRSAVQAYSDQLSAIDLARCPSDFRQAFTRHVGAWRGMAMQLQTEPDGAIECFVYGFLKGLTGDLSGGGNEILNSRRHHLRKIQETWTDVEVAAAKHGAK